MPVIGKVFLGLAGAYLLRALAESGSIPKWAVACVALVYAGLWLLWAARTAFRRLCKRRLCNHSRGHSSAHAVGAHVALQRNASAVRGHGVGRVCRCRVGAGVEIEVSAVVWSPAVFASVAAVVLLLGTRDPFPFTLALLLMALMTEAAASTGRWLGLAPLGGLPADLAVLALICNLHGPRWRLPGVQAHGAADLLALSSAGCS